MKSLMFVLATVVFVLGGAFAAPARADQCDELTYMTFSAPVTLPGMTLPAGTYRFRHPECAQNTHILQVTSADGMNVYATLMTTETARANATASNQPEVVFAEMPKGTAEAIKAWFYPGQTIGDELVYPDTEARLVAQAPQQKVYVEAAGL